MYVGFSTPSRHTFIPLPNAVRKQLKFEKVYEITTSSIFRVEPATLLVSASLLLLSALCALEIMKSIKKIL